MDAKKVFGAARTVALATLCAGGLVFSSGCKAGDSACGTKSCGSEKGEKSCSGDKKCGTEKKCGGDKACGGK